MIQLIFLKDFNIMSTMRRLFAATCGNFIEWYDFALYLFLAPVMAHQFFPEQSHQTALLGALTMYAVSFFFRPLGAIIFGHLGDVYGRRIALRWSLSLLAGLSIAISLLPTYQSIGFWAPVFLCLCRIGQGICLGGEFAGSMVYLAESAPVQQQAFMSSMSNNGSNFGILVASGSAALLSSLMGDALFEQLGYRLLFFFGGLVGLLGFSWRNDIQETTAFLEREKAIDVPLKYVIQFNKKELLRLFLILSISAVGSYGFIGSLSMYLQQSLELSMSQALSYETQFIALTLLLVPCCAWIADRVSPKRMFEHACFGYLILAVPIFFMYLQFKNPLYLLPLLLIYCMEQASTPALMCSFFPAAYRYTAVSLAYNTAMALIGGLSPLLVQLIFNSRDSEWSIACLLIGSSLLALISLAWKKQKVLLVPGN